MKDKVIYVLAILVGTAIITAIVGDYVTAALETMKARHLAAAQQKEGR